MKPLIAKKIAQKLMEQVKPLPENAPVEMTPEQLEQKKRFDDMFRPEELDPELKPYLEKTGGKVDWPILRHPLVVSVPYTKEMNRMHNQQLKYKKEWLAEKEKAKAWDSAIYIHERPFRLQAFLKYMHHMNDKEYWENLSSIWIDSEGPGVNKKVWTELFNAQRPGREFLMSDEERKAYNNLPEVLTVYRGSEKKDKTGMSWTLNKAKAKWFSKRFMQQGQVWEATVNKADTYAYFTNRGEEEVLVNPRALKAIKRIAVHTEVIPVSEPK